MTLEPVRKLFCLEPSGNIIYGDWLNTTFQTIPHVAECAQHFYLSWLPAIFLLIFCPLSFYDLYRSENARAKRCSPVTYKIMICVALVIDLTLSFIYNIYNYFILDRKSSLQYVVGDCAQYIGLCVALTVLIACRNRGIITSGVLFIYWLLMVLCGLPELRYLFEQYWADGIQDEIHFYLYTAYYPLVCLELFLSCFADTPSGAYKGKQICPELSTSFLNQITFTWFTGLAIQGYKRPLEREDLWDLNDRDKACNLIPQFYRFFRPQLDRLQEERKQKSSTSISADRHPSVLVPLFKTYRFTFISGALLKFTFDILQFVAPALLKYLISFIQIRRQRILRLEWHRRSELGDRDRADGYICIACTSSRYAIRPEKENPASEGKHAATNLVVLWSTISSGCARLALV